VRLIIMLLMLCPLFTPASLFASDEALASEHAAKLALLLDGAISRNLIAGGVVVVGNQDGIIATSARGQLNAAPGSPQLDERSMFDVASLTKVIATAPAVMKLVDEGRISLSDPVSRWFPEFAAAGYGEITILNLLTHTSGLKDIMVGAKQSMPDAIRKAAAQKYRPQAGSHFRYADINFILLGELVLRLTGETLDVFCQEQIYGPLGTADTMFIPPRELAAAIAPTSGTMGGVVQDLNARRLGGVAGHAGLFSSAYDLSRYARLMLGRGVIDERRILSENVVAQMTTPYSCSQGQVLRGLGWDMESPYSAPKGSFFSAASFGHTGYSGSSIWIDPQQDLFVILLTRRLNYSDTRNFNQLRRDISTMASVTYRMPDEGLGLTPRWEVAKFRAAQVLVAAETAMQAPRRRTKVAARCSEKLQPRLRANRQIAKKDQNNRRLAKSGSGPRISRISKVARADAAKTGHSVKKRRTLLKS